MNDLVFNILFVITSLYVFLKAIFYAIYEIQTQDNKAGRNWGYCIFCDCYCICYCCYAYEMIKRKNEGLRGRVLRSLFFTRILKYIHK